MPRSVKPTDPYQLWFFASSPQPDRTSKPYELNLLPTNNQQTTMCLGIFHIHIECQHLKKIHVVDPCPQANPPTCPNLTSIHSITITAPRLCLACFRQKEARMDVEFENTRMNMQDEIARVDERFANGLVTSEEGARRLRGYREECEDDIVQARAARDLKIRLFRHRQGVWGDG